MAGLNSIRMSPMVCAAAHVGFGGFDRLHIIDSLEALDKVCFTLVGIDERGLLNAVRTYVRSIF